MLNIITFPESNELSAEKEFERYKIIFQYFDENPQRIESNERYLTEVVDRSVELSMFNKNVPQNLRNLISKTLQDFLTKNKEYEYI